MKVALNYPDKNKENSLNFPDYPQKKKADIEKLTEHMLSMKITKCLY